MNMNVMKQQATRLCVVTAMLSIVLLPTHEAKSVSDFNRAPVLVGSALVPIPSEKPELVETMDVSTQFKSMTLNVANLFKSNTLSENVPSAVGSDMTGKDAALYRQIFAKQARGDMDGAKLLVKQLHDNRLIGHVLYQRYMHPTYNSSYHELRTWMDHYADFAQADDIYKLAMSRKGEGELKKPTATRVLAQIKEPTIVYAKTYHSSVARNNAQNKEVRDFFRKVEAKVRVGKTLDALKYFTESPQREHLDAVEHDQLQTVVAKGFLYSGRLDSALKLAQKSADRSGKFVPESAWVAGLVLWQQGDYKNAARYFDVVGQSAYASGWLAAGGSYWAARSYGKAGDAGKRKAALRKAAVHSRTFYGLLAAGALGQKPKFDWDTPKFNKLHEELILSHTGGARALDLVAAGQYDLAEAELMRLPYKGDMKLRRAVLAYASHVGLPGIALRLGNMVQAPGGKYYDSAMYPVSPWEPENGYKVDPALVHAVIRQESRFDLNAKSYTGALGLMQVMPKTAEYVAKVHRYDEDMNTVVMRIPEKNMKIGQDYLTYLLNGKYVKGNVVDLLVAYNAGPGNLLKWRKRMNGNADPLLFIETLPVQETRDYVERVLSNYWIYRHRAGLDLPTLAALSKGKKPQYAHVMQAESPYKLAAN